MERNKHIDLAFYSLLVGSALSIFVAFGIYTNLPDGQWLLLFTLSTISLSLFIAFKIRQGKPKFLKLAFWLFAIQIVSFDFGDWAFSLILGFSFHISWAIGESEVTVNSFAILMTFILYRAINTEKYQK